MPVGVDSKNPRVATDLQLSCICASKLDASTYSICNLGVLFLPKTKKGHVTAPYIWSPRTGGRIRPKSEGELEKWYNVLQRYTC